MKKQLFVSLVRNIVEHCTPVWLGLSFKNIAKLENIQCAATRYILNSSELCYTERLNALNLLPLSYRIDFTDLVFFIQMSTQHD